MVQYWVEVSDHLLYLDQRHSLLALGLLYYLDYVADKSLLTTHKKVRNHFIDLFVFQDKIGTYLKWKKANVSRSEVHRMIIGVVVIIANFSK